MRAVIGYQRDNCGLGDYTIQTRIVVADQIDMEYTGADRRPYVREIRGVESDARYTSDGAAGMLRSLADIGVEVVDFRRYGTDGTPIEIDNAFSNAICLGFDAS